MFDEYSVDISPQLACMGGAALSSLALPRENDLNCMGFVPIRDNKIPT